MPSGGGAGRFRVRTGLPPARRGASPPANPCSLVDKHHAPRPEPAFHRLGVVLHSPQTLVPSSTGTTPLGSNRPSTGSAWCFTPRKPLFLRQQAPRPRVRTGFPPIRRGASLPANPCSFVDGHHAPRHEPAFLQFSVVLLSPQALVPSSTSTTPPGSNVSSGGSAWCFPPRKPMFLRRRAPRPQARTGLPPIRRGASLPANPCSFVDEHHVPRHEPTFPGPAALRCWKRHRCFLLLPTKKQKAHCTVRAMRLSSQ